VADYEILTDTNTPIPARDITARTVTILIEADDPDAAGVVLRKAARDLLTGDALTIHAYTEREAVEWQGWVGRVEYFADGAPRVFFDNNPVRREAVWRDLKGIR
jgi:hypothetical protein